MEAVRWKINLFGRISAERGDLKVTSFRTEKTGLLLATLAQEPHKPFRRDDLVDRLWPDQPAEVGKGRLRVVLSYLRDILESDPGDRGKIIISDRSEIRLAPEFLTTDTLEFEEKLIRAGRAQDEGERICLLEAAVDQYQAEFLPEYDQFWVTVERQRLGDSYQMALRRLVKAHIAQRSYDRALAIAQKAVRADPYREETHRLLMKVYGLLGRPGAALLQYQELERLLKTQLGTAPTSETQEALAIICGASDSTARPANRKHRTAVAPLAPATGPAKRSTEQPLPVVLTPLIGREDAIVEVLEMLDTPETRLVNLKGVGGVGKSRLAAAVAERIRSNGASVRFVPLVGLKDPDNFVTHLAAIFHLPLRPRDDLFERLIEVMANEVSVLVFDNVEHLLPKAARTIQRILESIPSLSCLTTSRQRLGIPGEYLYHVKPLPTPQISDDIQAVAESPSVRLWLDRVRAAAPDFRLTAANCRDVAAVCRALEGLPLSLELAAAWSDVLGPKQIAARLQAPFDLLVSREHRYDGRHSSLRATLDWSYDLLTQRIQQFFARLGRFRSGWTFEGAEAVGGDHNTLQALATLQERSLIYTEETASGLRYQFLDSIREYAMTKLAGQALAETNRTYCDYCLQLSSECSKEVMGHSSGNRMMQLHEEQQNLRTALALAVEDDDRPELALRMSIAMTRFWYMSGAMREGRQWLTAALARIPFESPDRLKGLASLGSLAYGEADADVAEQCYCECLQISTANRDRLGIAMALGNLSNVRRIRGNHRGAQAFALRSLRIFRRLNEARGVSLLLGNLAQIARDRGDLQSAYTYGEQAIEQFRLLGDLQNLLTGLLNHSVVIRKLQLTRRSAALLVEAVDLCTSLGATRTLAKVLAASSNLAQQLGDHLAAVRFRAASDAIWSRLGLSTGQHDLEPVMKQSEDFRRLLGTDTVEREYAAATQISDSAAANHARCYLASHC